MLLAKIHFGHPNLLYILMGRQSITYKMSCLQNNYQLISDSYSYHWSIIILEWVATNRMGG